MNNGSSENAAAPERSSNMEIRKDFIDRLTICPFEVKHEEMLLNIPERDKRLDAVTYCDHTDNTETHD